ncbi:uncharacterized protein LOC124655522 isoform X3 [Lolium rigidum]|uniref:uncharacterized protein LOC124655522 isoform X3 n=1 Tax=Lolium rigidum TaxID=89674 RepID=UPI001F5C6ECE|nr:uncharacterized protein LOC124655522 isoform X3 [Lolium rigidum]
MEDPPGSALTSSRSAEPSGRASHAPLPPPPPPPVPPPPRHSLARGRRSASHSRRTQLFSFGSLPYQLGPRMPRRGAREPFYFEKHHIVFFQNDARELASPFEMLSVDDAPPPTSNSPECSELGTTNTDISRSKVSSSDNLPHTPGSADGHDCNKYNEESSGEADSDTCQYSSDDDSDEDGECPFGNPLLRDSYGKLTDWRLSDLDAAFTKHLEDEAKNPKPKERKLTKEEKLKIHSDRMEGYMKFALHQYNIKKELVEDMRFEFEKAQSQNWIVEGEFDDLFYYHFNFTAKQTCSSVFTFFAEVTPEDGDDCDVLCCRLLNDDDNGHCFGCENEGVDDLRHPACKSAYVGGHEDRGFPFMENSETEDDSD